jgi:hypothetical protein
MFVFSCCFCFLDSRICAFIFNSQSLSIQCLSLMARTKNYPQTKQWIGLWESDFLMGRVF